MEHDNNNNDHLDRFLHKAFDNFSANPSDQLWDKINAGITPAPPVRPSGIAVKPLYVALAAATVLLLFVAQHYYFHSKLEQIQTQLEQQQMAASPAEPSRVTPISTDNTTQPTTTSQTPISTSPNSISSNTHAQTTTITPSYTKTTTPSYRQQQSPKSTTPKETTNTTPIPNSPTDLAQSHNLSPTSSSTTINATQQGDGTNIPSAPSTTATQKMATTALISYFPSGKLPTKLYPSEKKEKIQLINLPYTRIKPQQSTAIGLHAMMANSYMAVKATPPDRPGFPGDDDKLFVDESTTKGTLVATGITVERTLNRHWSLCSGLDYTQHTINKSIRPQLRFDDRDDNHNIPGHDPNEHDFTYSIGTGAGTYEIDVEVRETDPTVNIQPEENISFTIQTEEKVQLLSLPLQVKYRLNKRNWNVYLAGGLRTNTVLSKEEAITGFSCDNQLLEIKGQPSVGRPPKNIKRAVTLDYTASAGVEYRMGNIGINVASVFGAPLIKPIKDDKLSVSNYWAGVNIGAQYYF